MKKNRWTHGVHMWRRKEFVTILMKCFLLMLILQDHLVVTFPLKEIKQTWKGCWQSVAVWFELLEFSAPFGTWASATKLLLRRVISTIHGKLTAFHTACWASSTHPLSQCSSAHVNFIVGLIPVKPLEPLMNLFYCFINFTNTLQVLELFCS